MAKEKELKMEEEVVEKASNSKYKLIIILLVGAVILVGGGAGAMLFLMGEKPDTEPVEEASSQRAPAHYMTLKPAFVTNYTVGKRQRYLQVEMTLVTRNEGSLTLFEEQMPMIRNDIVTFLSQQDFEELREPESRDTLRQALLETLQTKLEEETGESGVEDVLFTAFVMQ